VESDYKMDVPKEWVAEAKKIEKAQKAVKTNFVRGNQLHLMPSIGNTPGYVHGGGFGGGYNYNGYYDEIPDVSKKQDDQNVAIALPSKITTSAGTKV